MDNPHKIIQNCVHKCEKKSNFKPESLGETVAIHFWHHCDISELKFKSEGKLEGN